MLGAGSPFFTGLDCQHRALIKGAGRLPDDLSPSRYSATVSSNGDVAGSLPWRRQNFLSTLRASHTQKEKVKLLTHRKADLECFGSTRSAFLRW